MTQVTTDFPDWSRFSFVIPTPVATPPPPVTLGGGNIAVGLGWQLMISGALKIMRFTISNPHFSDGNQARASSALQDPVWIQYLNHGDPAPTDGVTSGIYLPSPGFLYDDEWRGDVYICKANEIAAQPGISFQLIVSAYP